MCVLFLGKVDKTGLMLLNNRLNTNETPQMNANNVQTRMNANNVQAQMNANNVQTQMNANEIQTQMNAMRYKR